MFSWSADSQLCLFMGALSLISMSVAVLRLFAQRDLKRMVAYMTIIETNWLVFCFSCGSAPFVHLAFFLMAVHGFTTALGFLFVEALGRRFHTRDWTQVSGLYMSSPHLWVLSFALLLLLIGFPGTPLFFAKLLFLTLLYPLAPAVTVYFSLLFLVLIPLFLFRVWVSMWVGHPTQAGSRFTEISSQEAVLALCLTLGALLLGFFPLGGLGFALKWGWTGFLFVL